MNKLIKELEQAADWLDRWAKVTIFGWDIKPAAALAARLRQRAAWVRELGAKVGMGSAGLGGCDSWTFRALTGPIPAATPCAGCLPAEGDYGDGPPPMVLGRHVEGCNWTAPTERPPK